MDLSFVVTFIIAFLVAAISGPFIITALRRLKVGQKILEIGPKWHMNKQNIPTMGGFIFILAMVAAMAAAGFLFGWEHSGRWILVLSMALVFGAIGFIDDWHKVKKSRNKGLGAKQKFLLQLAVAILFITLMRYFGLLNPVLAVPFFNISIELPWILYIPLIGLVIVGAVNASNLTDGVDGLASSVTLVVMAFFALTAWYLAESTGNASMESLALLPIAACGGLGGFLLYNFNPAKVIMGDTGSLFLGGLVAGVAVAIDLPLILILVGIVYIIETLSVMIQVTYFKLTGGKRIFKMAPIHHHFEMCGFNEKQIVLMAFAVTLLFCVLAYFGVRGYYPIA